MVLFINGIECQTKHAPLWWHEKGLTQTATGYGARITSATLIQYRGRWRRVYCRIYSNVGTCYIGKFSENLIVREYINYDNRSTKN